MKHLVLTASLCSLLLGCRGTPCSGAVRSQHAAAQKSTAQVPSLPASDAIAASVPLMPHAVTSFGAAALDGAVYALGGYAGVPHAYSREGQSGELYRLALDTKAPLEAWSKLPATEASQGTPLVVFQGSLVAAGGMQARNASGQTEDIHSLADVRAFDPGTQSWRALPPLPEARSSHALVAHGDKLFVVGGWTLTGARKEGTFARTGFVYDAKTQAWSELAQPFQLRALAAAMLDGKLVVLGGMDANARTSQAVHIYDPESQTWSRGPDLPTDGFGIAATSNGDSLFASARNGVLYALDDVQGPFRAAAKLAYPRFFHQLVMAGPSRVVALGGISGMHFGSRIRPVETIDLTRQGPRVLTFTLKTPLSGRNRQGVFAAGDSLCAFGGNRSLNQHDFTPADFADDAACLDLSGMFWEPIESFPYPRQTVQTLVFRDHALAVGGFGFDAEFYDNEGQNSEPKSAARAQSEAFRFDFESERWNPSPHQLEKPRTQFGLTVHGHALYIFGGLDYDPARGDAEFEHPRSVLRATAEGPFRASGIELPHARRAFGGAKLGDSYYLVGGMADAFAPVTSCEQFSFASQSFSELPCPSQVRISPQLVALDDKLYLAGGSSPGEGGLVENPTLEVFDPQTQSWSTLLERLPISPRHLTMVAWGNSLILYSAHNEEGVANVALIVPE